jgi:uncharacterized membrane protein YdjX (TVP38/TMEM64 family)
MTEIGARGSSKPTRSRSYSRWVIVLVALVALVFLIARAGPIVQPYLERFAVWVDGLGPVGPIVFISGYVLATVALIPASALTLASGAVFGLARGVVYAFLAAAIGAALSFLIARYVARSRVESRIAGDPKFAAIDRAIGASGLLITALLRLSPVFPFSLLNYALGITRVRFLHYNLASFAMLPGTFLYVYLGTLGGEAAKGEAKGWQDWTLRIVGLVATIVVTTIVTRVARRALQEATNGEGSGETQPVVADPPS